ncbi:Rxt3-domain-containing protein [Tuber magnatum]|uniref:Rxt3-domain-containing protein n=1 Tax=Tuber magnatum TaxID=42249 RepID=A0A317SJH3_9PEZI|nr:Rxt3-domain-containing protein [Tuber magnatum]
MAGRPLYGEPRQVGHQQPQTSTSHLSYPLTITSRIPSNGPQTHMEISGVPSSMSGMPNSAAISLPQTSTAGAGGLGPTPAPLPTAATAGREDLRPFTGYTTPMPPSPFAMPASLPTVLPPVGDGARDSRRQNLQGVRDEPARAEDALQRGLSRALSGGLSNMVGEEGGRRRVEKERDGNARMSGPSAGSQSPNKRLSSSFSIGMGMPNMTKSWDDSIQKAFPEINREDGRLSNALGKRERDEEEVGKTEKKKKHHHHPPHVAHYHRHHHKVDDEPAGPNLEIPPARVVARSKSPNSMSIPHSHPVHQVTVHHHHPAAVSPALPPQRVKTSLLIDSSKVLASLASKPRQYLGSTIYQPTPTPKQGYSITQPLLPRFEGRENCIFQVRIPRRFLSVEQRRDVHKRRCVWGTEVYTDDSDVLGVLVHLGKVPGVLPEGVTPDLVAETRCRKTTSRGEITNMPSTNPSLVKKKGKGAHVVGEGPAIQPGKDLIVNLLILPTLQKYTGSVRNALKSRSWNTIHDGMSYSIWDMEWVEAGEAEARGGGSRKRRLDEREWVRRWGELPPSRGGGGVGKVGWNKGRWSESTTGMRKGNVTEVGA